MILSKKRITKALIRLRGCAGWSAPVLFANSRRQVISRQGQYNVRYSRNKPYNQSILTLTFASKAIPGNQKLLRHQTVCQMLISSVKKKSTVITAKGQILSILTLIFDSKIVSEYDQEIPQSQTADNPVAPRGRAAQPSRDTRKTN